MELNEPLNTQQRLCEELEYSELLDKAAWIPSALKRKVYVAAFAMSAYTSSYFWAGSKPFNPVLGEIYECIRQDKGFHFFQNRSATIRLSLHVMPSLEILFSGKMWDEKTNSGANPWKLFLLAQPMWLCQFLEIILSGTKWPLVSITS